MLNPEQYNYLIKPITPSRVQNLRGMAHLEAWDVRRWLIRIFGFGGFTIETIELSCIKEIDLNGDGKRWTVIYRAQVRLTVRDNVEFHTAHYEDAASGDSRNQPSLGDAHDMAMKTALSQALKRCAVNLGDQFGLSLYNNGGKEAVVNMTLAGRPGLVKAVEKEAIATDPPVRAEQAAEAADFEVGEENYRPQQNDMSAIDADWLDKAEQAETADQCVEIYKQANEARAGTPTLAAIRSVGELLREAEKATASQVVEETIPADWPEPAKPGSGGLL